MSMKAACSAGLAICWVGIEGAAMTPKQVVEEWVRRFNRADADGLADLYHEDAVNHQVALAPVDGRAAILAVFRKEFATAEMTCIPEIIHEAGDVAILEWKDPLGLRGCGFFTVRNDCITFQRGYWDKLSFLTLHGLPVE
jgi:limonene-1,2-epoxide hydrolase